MACSSVPEQIVKIEYIKQPIPALPNEPVYYPVVWGTNYALDIDNAKNLIRNRVLDKEYMGQLKLILEGLK